MFVDGMGLLLLSLGPKKKTNGNKNIWLNRITRVSSHSKF